MAGRRTKYPRWYVVLRNTRDWLIAAAALGSIRLIKFLPADPAINATAKLARLLGMLHPRTEDARKNLRLAFPEKTDEEIEKILRGMWEHMGRTGAEYAFLDKIFDVDFDNPHKSRFEIAGIPNFEELREHDGPAICFTAHTGNWEVLPIAAAAFGLNITALFRPPNNPFLARKLLKARKTAMGHLVPSRAGAAWALSGVMDEGGKIGLLADQYYDNGPMVTFFGHKAAANPLLAKLARNYDCPVYPARTIRLPGGRYRIELQDRLELPRDEAGGIDTDATTQLVNTVMEGWIREHPQQWLWLHRRWRSSKPRRRKRSRRPVSNRPS